MMTVDMVTGVVLGVMTFVVPITLTVMVSGRPQLLTPARKLGVSLVLIVASFFAPLFFPALIEASSSTNPVIVALLYSLCVMPQGLIGVAIASALLLLKLAEPAVYNVNFAWWWTLLLGMIWSVLVLLVTGVAFAGW